MRKFDLARNRRRAGIGLLLWGIGGFTSVAVGQDAPSAVNPLSQLHWQTGPATVKLGDQAELKVPKGFLFADRENTARFLEATHNLPDPKALGVILPAGGSWWAIFEFDDIGYVKDNEKDKLDADALLKSIQESTEEGNQERRSRGWDTFTVRGWLARPFYDEATHRLTWSIVGESSKGQRSANYRTRILGRHGVMSVELIASPEEIDAALPAFKNAATTGFSFTQQHNYLAYVPGDKVAEYGLSALILGGAAAAAVKTGFLKYILKLLIVGWKFILVGFAVLAGFIRKLFKGREPVSQPSTE